MFKVNVPLFYFKWHFQLNFQVECVKLLEKQFAKLNFLQTFPQLLIMVENCFKLAIHVYLPVSQVMLQHVVFIVLEFKLVLQFFQVIMTFNG